MKCTYTPSSLNHGAYIELHPHRDYILKYEVQTEKLHYCQGYNYVNGSKLPNHYRCYKPDKIPMKYQALYDKCKELSLTTFKDNIKMELEIEI